MFFIFKGRWCEDGLCIVSLEFGGGLLPYIAGACCWAGYGFWPRCREQGILFYMSVP